MSMCSLSESEFSKQEVDANILKQGQPIFQLKDPIIKQVKKEEEKVCDLNGSFGNIPIANEPQQPQEEAKKAQEKRKFRCLIANDESIQLDILKYMFEKVNMEVTVAINGYQAFEILSKQVEETRFDLVLLDLNMPISDGYETCKNITKYFHCEGIFKLYQSHNSDHSSSNGATEMSLKHYKPVIVALSSFVNDQVQQKTSKAGFDLTLQGPLHINTLKSEIMPLLIKRKENQEFQIQSQMFKQMAIDRINQPRNSREDLLALF